MKMINNKLKKTVVMYIITGLALCLSINNVSAKTISKWGQYLHINGFNTSNGNGGYVGYCIKPGDTISDAQNTVIFAEIPTSDPDFGLFNANTTSSVIIDFGDGAIEDLSMFTQYIYDPNSRALGYFYPWTAPPVKHVYNSPGTYDIKTIISFSNGVVLKDSISIDVVPASQCNLVNGYVYFDLNGNCIDDNEPRVNDGHVTMELNNHFMNAVYLDSIGGFSLIPINKDSIISLSYKVGFLYDTVCQKQICNPIQALSSGTPLAIGLVPDTTNSPYSVSNIDLTEEALLGLNNNNDTIYCTNDTVRFGLVDSHVGYNILTCQNKKYNTVKGTMYWGDGSISTVLPTYNQYVPNNLQFDNIEHIYTVPGIYVPYMILSDDYGWVDSIAFKRRGLFNPSPFSHPNVLLVESCGNVEGATYYDANNNCTLTGVDTKLANQLIQAKQGTTVIRSTFTNANGHYNLNLPVGTGYKNDFSNVTYNTFYTPSCGLPTPYTITASNTVNEGDVAFQCNWSGQDLAVRGWGTRFRPGVDGQINVTYGNFSCINVQNAVVTLTLDPKVSYVSTNSGITPTSVSGNTVTWNLANVPNRLHESLLSNIKISTDASVTIGDTVCFTLTIDPIAYDGDSSNNVFTFCTPVRNSWDPNEKQVYPTGKGITGDIEPGTDLTYTIHFQNEGNDDALNIYLLDTLSSNLDLGTFRILSSSHTMQANVNPEQPNIMKFDFPNINLPAKSQNEPLSHGYVTYSVKVKAGIALGSQIKNTAHIFFDINPAVVTNTTLNTIATPTTIKKVAATNYVVNVQPNPANDKVAISLGVDVNGAVMLYDVLGNQVDNVKLIGGKAQLTTQNIANGIYSVVVITDGNKTTTKLIVAH